VKHQTGWAVEQGDDGTLKWTSPAGKHYATHPATRIRPTNPTAIPTLARKRWVDPWTLPVTDLDPLPF